MTEYGRPCDRSSRRLWEPREAGLGGADGQQFREDARRWSGTMAMPPERPGPDVGAGSKQAALGGEKQHRDRHTSRGATWGGRRGGVVSLAEAGGAGAGRRQEAGRERTPRAALQEPHPAGEGGPGSTSAAPAGLVFSGPHVLSTRSRTSARSHHSARHPATCRPRTPHPPPGKEREPTPALRGTPHGGNGTRAAST